MERFGCFPVDKNNKALKTLNVAMRRVVKILALAHYIRILGWASRLLHHSDASSATAVLDG
jgi:hypothetical protein